MLLSPTAIGINQHPFPIVELISAYHTHAGKEYLHIAPKGKNENVSECFVLYRSAEGEGVIKTTLEDILLPKNGFAIVKNAERIALQSFGECWRYYSVFFFAEGLRLPINTPYFFDITNEEEKRLQEILSLLQTGDFLHGAKANALFQNLLFDFLLKTDDKTDASPYAEIMQKTAKYIRENLGNDLSVEYLAKNCSFSKNHFCNVFKGYFGMTPKAYILKTKLEKAKLLLLKTDLPVAEIAEELAFYSPAHFAYAFKREYGVTPLNYRKKG